MVLINVMGAGVEKRQKGERKTREEAGRRPACPQCTCIKNQRSRGTQGSTGEALDSLQKSLDFTWLIGKY